MKMLLMSVWKANFGCHVGSSIEAGEQAGRLSCEFEEETQIKVKALYNAQVSGAVFTRLTLMDSANPSVCGAMPT